MKRSVIQFAGKTLLISLPKQWAIAQHIKKGQELDVLPEGDKLLVSAVHAPSRWELSLTEEDTSWFIADILSYLYQLGVDEIVLRYAQGRMGRELQEKVSALLGYEIVEHSAQRMRIRNVALQLDEEFPALVRRSFFIVEEMGNLLIKEAQKPTAQGKDEMRSLDATLNKLTDFCKRTINKSEAETVLRATITYTLVRDLERIGDCLRNALVSLERGVSPGMQQKIERIRALFQKLHVLAYDYSSERADAFIKESRQLISLFKTKQGKFSQADMMLHAEMYAAAQYIKDLFGPLYMRELSKKKTLAQK
jgi:phosphate uptake regulator